MARFLEFVVSVQQAVLYYSVISLKPILRDAVIKEYMVPSTAATMMTTAAALGARSSLQMNRYLYRPSDCSHPSGMRSYGASELKIRICDLCGQRWILMPERNLVPASAKSSPSSRTPLDVPDSVKKKLGAPSGRQLRDLKNYNYKSPHAPVALRQ